MWGSWCNIVLIIYDGFIFKNFILACAIKIILNEAIRTIFIIPYIIDLWWIFIIRPIISIFDNSFIAFSQSIYMKAPPERQVINYLAYYCCFFSCSGFQFIEKCFYREINFILHRCPDRVFSGYAIFCKFTMRNFGVEME